MDAGINVMALFEDRDETLKKRISEENEANKRTNTILATLTDLQQKIEQEEMNKKYYFDGMIKFKGTTYERENQVRFRVSCREIEKYVQQKQTLEKELLKLGTTIKSDVKSELWNTRDIPTEKTERDLSTLAPDPPTKATP